MPGSERYSRQEMFAGIGREGQRRLRRSSAVLLGCGAIGSLQAELLVRAGIGRLRIIDRDFVEGSNLQRQFLFGEEDAVRAMPKAAAAATHLGRINSDVAVEGTVEDLVPGNALALLEGFDLLLDGSDNFEVRFLLNDVALRTSRPWIYGACVGAYGVSFTVRPRQGACLRCLMPEPPGAGPTCDTAGVVGPAVGMVASLQAAEALKLLTGQTGSLREELVAFDLWQGTFQSIRVPRDPACGACAGGRLEFLEGGRGSASTRLCGRGAVQISPGTSADAPDLEALAGRLGRAGEVVANPFLVRARIGEFHLTVFRDGRAIVGGTEDAAVARSLYSRYVGS